MSRFISFYYTFAKISCMQCYKIRVISPFTLFVFILSYGLSFFTLNGQTGNWKKVAHHELSSNPIFQRLAPGDLSDISISDQYTTKHNQITHIYVQQRYQGIPIHNAISGLHFQPNLQIAFATNRFHSNLSARINTTASHFSPEEMVKFALEKTGSNLSLEELSYKPTSSNQLEVHHPSKLLHPILVELLYFPIHPSTTLKLSWSITIPLKNSEAVHHLIIDATNQDVLQQKNLALNCSHSHCPGNHLHTVHFPKKEKKPIPFEDKPAYQVFPIPIESPLFGERSILIDPADSIASPFGWHSISASNQPNFTTTLGNNAHAYADRDNDNLPDQNPPDGSTQLQFIFPFDENLEPISNQDAAIVQSFYMTNIMHDIAYRYGFDENAGNFQATNFDLGGNENDLVVTQIQDGAGLNNANFYTPSDGFSPRMQLYLFDSFRGNLLEILDPKEMVGSYKGGTASFGPPLDTLGITGEIVLVDDGSRNGSFACNDLINPSDIKGKIALIDRGNCFFQEKTMYAEAAGAIGVIICNYEDNVNSMGGIGGIQPTIPSISIGQNDCQKIKLALSQNVVGKLSLPNVIIPKRKDAAFDNGIIAHEYAHGISIRLTGGPGTNSCLDNDEEMGEGWSDFFALALTSQYNGAPPSSRGIGNYVIRAGVNGNGVRRLPYSTDMDINDYNYDDIIGSTTPHSLGEVWASMLWDLYWAFVDKYGWSDNFYNGQGGNNMVLQLVMDGLKLQACQPGFVSGRDAILAADQILNNGANQCLIWEVFARRGLGWNAQENSPLNRHDGRADFTPSPFCENGLKVFKTVTPTIFPGDTIWTTLRVINHQKQMAESVTLIDTFPTNGQFLGLSIPGITYFTINNTVQVNDLSIPSGDTIIIDYATISDPLTQSDLIFMDSFETAEGFWKSEATNPTNPWTFQFDSTIQKNIWKINVSPIENEATLFLDHPIRIDQAAVLKISHAFSTELGFDGGIIEISTDDGNTWQYVPSDQIFRMPYTGRLSFNTFFKNDMYAFVGKSEGVVDSYISLEPYLGSTLKFRFRFTQDQEENPDLGNDSQFWSIHGLSVFELKNYYKTACVSAENSEADCALPPGKGTILNPSSITTQVVETSNAPFYVEVFPNPADQAFKVSIHSKSSGEGKMTIRNLSGQAVNQKTFRIFPGKNTISGISLGLEPGLYFITTSVGNHLVTHKIVIQH